MVVDQGGCDPYILNSFNAELGGFSANGPPGCTPSTHPLERMSGGQVLKIANSTATTATTTTDINLVVTMKIHRAVVNDDGVYPYFVIWDSSLLTSAGLYGVPQSRRLVRAGSGWLEGGVDIVNFFANGPSCPACSTYGVQEPIFPVVLDTPLHEIRYLIWACTESGTASTLLEFLNSITDTSLCYNVLQRAASAGLVENGTSKLFYADIPYLRSAQRIVQTLAPPSSDLGGKLEIMNTPVVLFLNMPSTSTSTSTTTTVDPSRIVIVEATNNVLAWSVSYILADGNYTIPEFVYPITDDPNPIYLPDSFGNAIPIGKIFVQPDDMVVIRISGDNIGSPNGFLMGSVGIGVDSQAALDYFFSMDVDLFDASVLDYSQDSDMFLVFGNYPFGLNQPVGIPYTDIFVGYVNRLKVTSYIYLSSPVYGPAFMNAVFVVDYPN
eukprot:TRINITY_DN6493_c0_g1_i2.p1 TRINITY_DN6493_c0_g1~~TRINITY_DN6493_c0_g1_i2.p1  ORF type:complete len:477 (-),score=119.43 TRINITY_DN6493_c0_g1_i2:44-1360(-)